MFTDITADALTKFHEQTLDTPHWSNDTQAQFTAGVWKFIESNHRFNNLLWDEEDLARRKNVPDSEIAANKRAIDRYNQQRNDAIEGIDDLLLQRLQGITRAPDAWLNSETAGSMIDRLSIVSLKIFHMRLQTLRTDVVLTHIDMCQMKLARLVEQQTDLKYCLDTLLNRASKGDAYFKIYRQFKMYNDPTLNPCLYGEEQKK